jgi:hypothetical protein
MLCFYTSTGRLYEFANTLIIRFGNREQQANLQRPGAAEAVDLEVDEMTPNQRKAVWELCRQGLHEVADQAEKSWAYGHTFEPDQGIPLAREIAQLIRMCNWELRPIAA